MRTTIAANLFYFPAARLAGQPIRKLLAEYQGHDQWSSEQLRTYQISALSNLLSHAKHNVPRYGSALSTYGSGPTSTFEMLDQFPLLDKEYLRTHPEKLAAQSGSPASERKTTSGSTGNPVTVYKNAGALARERAATLRAYSWADIPVAAPQALFWGLPHTFSGRVRARTLDFLANRKRFVSFGFRESDLERYRKQLDRFRPVYLYGYVSAVLSFVEFLDANRRSLPASVRCIVTTSEILSDSTRSYLTSVTGRPVYNEYGCGEVGSIAHECEHSRLHVMSDNLILECCPSSDLPAGLGELVVTDLFNTSMPLIRYRVGDLGSLSADVCPCGRPYPLLERVVGRAYDLITDSVGKKYHPESILYVFEDLKRSGLQLPPFQVVQHEAGQLVVRLQATSGLSDFAHRALLGQFEQVFGGRMSTTIELTAQLYREKSGKLRLVKRTVAETSEANRSDG